MPGIGDALRLSTLNSCGLSKQLRFFFLWIDPLFGLINHPAAPGAIDHQLCIGKAGAIFSLHCCLGAAEITGGGHDSFSDFVAEECNDSAERRKTDKGEFFSSIKINDGKKENNDSRYNA
ncbi:hypothetical protein [Desulfogranum marinum]|uniref:hypothetical protein n=1 Tax=Desulfogranum marinum TaxID=453220 RepID=UPI0029C92011|nr:hypothetical protein [Desulfogranum marinum]